jgi:hypothetical protein
MVWSQDQLFGGCRIFQRGLLLRIESRLIQFSMLPDVQ